MSFSSVLQSLRKEAKVTQEDLAHNLGVSAQAVSKWENGSFPEGDLLPRIADYFHVSIDYLYGRAERDESIEQGIVHDLNEMWESYREVGSDKNDANRRFMEKIQKMLWSFHVGAWVENRQYVVNDNGQQEKAYGINMTLGGLLFGLFTVADAYVNAPNGFSIQINNRSRQWVNK